MEGDAMTVIDRWLALRQAHDAWTEAHRADRLSEAVHARVRDARRACVGPLGAW